MKGEGGREEALARHVSEDANTSFHGLQMFTSLFTMRSKKERVLVSSMWMGNVKESEFSLRFQVREQLFAGFPVYIPSPQDCFVSCPSLLSTGILP